MKKVAIVIGCLLLAGVGAVAAVDGYLRWQDPVGYRNLEKCSTIKPVRLGLEIVTERTPGRRS